MNGGRESDSSTHNRLVPGSSPGGPTKICLSEKRDFYFIRNARVLYKCGSDIGETVVKSGESDTIQLTIYYMPSMTKNETTIGQKIRVWRAKRDLTQDELAKKADIPYPTLIKIESDTVTNPTLDTITKIANGLEITLNELTS